MPEEQRNAYILCEIDGKNYEEIAYIVGVPVGTVRSRIFNLIEGVSIGYTKELELVGVGYKAAPKGKTLELNLGFSHPVNFEIPEDLKIEVPKPTTIKISGIDKQRVGQIAANIRSYRKPEPYKGKGVKYKDEHVRRKEGKKK